MLAVCVTVLFGTLLRCYEYLIVSNRILNLLTLSRPVHCSEIELKKKEKVVVTNAQKFDVG